MEKRSYAGWHPLAEFRWLPDDARQSLRIRRYAIAAATALLVIVLLVAATTASLVPRAAAYWASGAIVALVAAFYAVFRSGLNQRFRDPSLTFELCAVSTVVFGFILFHVGPLRGALDVVYAVILMFGVFRLDTRRMLALAAVALAVQGAVLGATAAGDPARGALDWARYGVLAVVLPWFALMAAYVSGLRRSLAESFRQLSDAKLHIEKIAVRDELTGLYNRRYLMEFLAQECARARRSGVAFSVCLIDLDNFKEVNHRFGNGIGDSVLQHLARTAEDQMRKPDAFGRLGGEEFLVVLPDTEIAGAFCCAERLRAAVERASFPGMPAEHRVTVTIGVARFRTQDEVANLLARVDRALDFGKAAGRNRVFVVGDAELARAA